MAASGTESAGPHLLFLVFIVGRRNFRATVGYKLMVALDVPDMRRIVD